jgi:hypothetical protein
LFDYNDMKATGWGYDDKQPNPMLVMQKSHGLNRTRQIIFHDVSGTKLITM